MKSTIANPKVQRTYSDNLIYPAWTAPDAVHAFTTTRSIPGFTNSKPYNDFNLGTHVGDALESVLQNRKYLLDQFSLPNEPLWLNQTHSAICIDAKDYAESIEADASYTNQPSTVLAIMTADCLPILICNKAGDEIAAIHAGWKSLGTGIIEATLEHFQNTDLHVWLAPAICGNHYEVGQDVFDVYCDHKAELANAFTTSCDKPEHYYLNLQQAAKIILHAHDIRHITDCGHCTYANSNNFYSYRRDGVTGRLGSLIYFE